MNHRLPQLFNDSRHERFIMLTIKKVNELFEYLPNGELKRKITTSPKSKKGQIVGNGDLRRYKYFSIDKIKYYNHRIVWFIHYGYMPKQIDHINGNRLDNRIENLRECNQSQNNWNQGIKITNKSGYKGVSWYSREKRWVAKLNIYGKTKIIGYFKNVEDAANEIKKFRQEFHKEFARNA